MDWHLNRHMTVCCRVGVQLPFRHVRLPHIRSDRDTQGQFRHQFRRGTLGFEQFLKGLNGAVLDVKHGIDPTGRHRLVPNTHVHVHIRTEREFCHHVVGHEVFARS